MTRKRADLVAAAVALALGAGAAAPASGMPALLPVLSAGWEGYARQALEHGACFTAKSLVEQAIAAGDAIGYDVLGEMYETGRCVPRSGSKAAESYTLAIRHGHEFAEAHLGYLVLHGLGVPKDVAFAKRLFRSFALDLAVFEPQHRPIVLRALMNRRPIPKELDEAMAWVREIETSDARTLYETALELKTGEGGLPKKERLARSWMSDAAVKGLVEAWYTLAMWQLEEPRGARDIERGLAWLYHAADEGRVRALEEYGRRLAEGRNVVQNDRDAYIVLMRAKAAGANVEDVLRKLRERLAPHELAEAENLLEGSWFIPFYHRSGD